MSAFTLMRLSQAPDIDALKRVWLSLSTEQKADPYIVEYKDTYKRALQGVKP